MKCIAVCTDGDDDSEDEDVEAAKKEDTDNRREDASSASYCACAWGDLVLCNDWISSTSSNLWTEFDFDKPLLT